MELELQAFSQKTLKANQKFFNGNPIEFYDKDDKRAEVEKELLKKTFKEALKRNTKLYKVKDNTNEVKDTLGYFAISVGNINVNGKNIPSAVLDYFILNNKYRKYKCEPDKYSLGIELFREILALMNDLSTVIGIRYIILEPLGSEKKLIKFYNQFDFKFIPVKGSTWMYLDIENLS